MIVIPYYPLVSSDYTAHFTIYIGNYSVVAGATTGAGVERASVTDTTREMLPVLPAASVAE